MTKEERDAFFSTLTHEQRVTLHEILQDVVERHTDGVVTDLVETCRRQRILMMADLGVALLAPPSPGSPSGDRPH